MEKKIFTELRELCLNESNIIASKNPLFLRAANGDLEKSELIKYVHFLFYIFSNTPITLNYALDKVKHIKNQGLFDFLVEKHTDEKGHHLWAQKDIEKLGLNEVDYTLITPETVRLIQYGRTLVDEDPELLLAHMFTYECLSIITGDKLLNDLEKNCGFSRSMVTGLDYHLELDVEHVEDDVQAMDQNISSTEKYPRLLEVVSRTLKLIDMALSSCTLAHESGLDTSQYRVAIVDKPEVVSRV